MPPLWPEIMRSSAPPSARPASLGARDSTCSTWPGRCKGCTCRTGKGCSSSVRAGSLGMRSSDAITDNDIRLSDLEPHLKERLRRLLPDYVCGINPLAAFSQDVEMVAKTIEICVDRDNVGSFIVVLQASELCRRIQVHRLLGQAHHRLRGGK